MLYIRSFVKISPALFEKKVFWVTDHRARLSTFNVTLCLIFGTFDYINIFNNKPNVSRSLALSLGIHMFNDSRFKQSYMCIDTEEIVHCSIDRIEGAWKHCEGHFRQTQIRRCSNSISRK